MQAQRVYILRFHKLFVIERRLPTVDVRDAVRRVRAHARLAQWLRVRRVKHLVATIMQLSRALRSRVQRFGELARQHFDKAARACVVVNAG